ncbi:hypothetical protein [Enterococcus faecium]|uniref:Uncharacterized protein n=1 Tax=Enterococcus faecium TaxID=1352 RepID=A0A9X3XS89_ENTFC|nr:hypothetical protein [Enterococcus faecium]MDC4248076.1 hypothetical protein [Enterococcus faecium]
MDWKWQYQFLVIRKWLLAFFKLSLTLDFFECGFFGWRQLLEFLIVHYKLSTDSQSILQESMEAIAPIFLLLFMVNCLLLMSGFPLRKIFTNVWGLFSRICGLGFLGLLVGNEKDLFTLPAISGFLISYSLYLLYRQYTRIQDEKLVMALQTEGIDLFDTNRCDGLKNKQLENKQQCFPTFLPAILLAKLELVERNVHAKYFSFFKIREVTTVTYKIKGSPYPLKITSDFQHVMPEAEDISVQAKEVEAGDYNE